MQKFPRSRWFTALPILMLCVPTLLSSARSTEGEFSFPLLQAERFLRELYPELESKGFIMTVELDGAFDVDWTSMPRFSVDVGATERGHKQYGVDQSGKLHVHEQEPVLGALFEFAPDGVLQAVHVNSRRILSDNQNQQVRRLVDSHAHWNDAQIIEILKQSGAKYGPGDKEAFLAQIPIEKLRPFIGTIHIESSEFRLRNPQPSGSAALLYWEVEATSAESGANRVRWTLICEPIGGRLISVMRHVSSS